MSVYASQLLLYTNFLFLGVLVISPTELVRFSGGSAVFECHFDSCDGLLWNGPDGIGLLQAQSYAITIREHTTTLSIFNLSEDDEGHYFCTCNGRNSTPADLIIHCKYSSYVSLETVPEDSIMTV